MINYIKCEKRLPDFFKIVWCIPEEDTPFRDPFLGYRILMKSKAHKYNGRWVWHNIHTNPVMSVKPHEVKAWHDLFPSQLKDGIREYVQ